MSADSPLGSLAPEGVFYPQGYPPAPMHGGAVAYKSEQPCYRGWLGGVGMFILWFIILTVITWLFIFSLKPSWVVNPTTGEVDTSKVLFASLIIALVIVIIIWLIRALIRGWGGGWGMGGGSGGGYKSWSQW